MPRTAASLLRRAAHHDNGNPASSVPRLPRAHGSPVLEDQQTNDGQQTVVSLTAPPLHPHPNVAAMQLESEDFKTLAGVVGKVVDGNNDFVTTISNIASTASNNNTQLTSRLLEVYSSMKVPPQANVPPLPNRSNIHNDMGHGGKHLRGQIEKCFELVD